MKTAKSGTVNAAGVRLIRVFQEMRYEVQVLESRGCLRIVALSRIPPGRGTVGQLTFSAMDAFEVSRLLRLGASLAEWVEDYGVEAAEDWIGLDGTTRRPRRRHFSRSES